MHVCTKIYCTTVYNQFKRAAVTCRKPHQIGFSWFPVVFRLSSLSWEYCTTGKSVERTEGRVHAHAVSPCSHPPLPPRVVLARGHLSVIVTIVTLSLKFVNSHVGYLTTPWIISIIQTSIFISISITKPDCVNSFLGFHHYLLPFLFLCSRIESLGRCKTSQVV